MAEEQAAEVETPQGEEEGQPTKEAEEQVEQPKEEQEETPKPSEEKIPVRSKAEYFYGQRQKEKLEKLAERLERLEQERAQNPSDEGEADPVEARIQRLEQLIASQSDDRDLSSFFEREPEAKKYEREIKQYMSHEAYKEAAPEVIYAYVSRSDRMAQTDSKRKAADLEAKQTRSAGSAVRQTRDKSVKTAEDIKNMTEAEFREYEQEQRRLARQ